MSPLLLAPSIEHADLRAHLFSIPVTTFLLPAGEPLVAFSATSLLGIYLSGIYWASKMYQLLTVTD